jgi:hypothetical protein
MKTIKEAVIGLTHLLKDDPEFFIQKPKQETTLEEAVNSFKKTDVYINEIKQKQERMYSEEDLREAFRQGMDNMEYSSLYGWSSELTEQEWFEQFKKK